MTEMDGVQPMIFASYAMPSLWMQQTDVGVLISLGDIVRQYVKDDVRRSVQDSVLRPGKELIGDSMASSMLSLFRRMYRG
jgi:hypothetical protein